jgi:hypothetical protein
MTAYVLVVKVVPMRQDVEPGARLVSQDDSQRIRKLLAENDVLQAA